MGRVPGPPHGTAQRLAAAGAALLAAGLVAGCGGSLADVDRPRAAHATRTPPGDFCAAVLAGADAARPLAALVERDDPDARRALGPAVDAVRRANADVLATAPAEIRPDVERAVAVADLQLDLLEDAGGDAGALARDAAVRRRVATQDYAVATQRVREYVTAHCGVDLR